MRFFIRKAAVLGAGVMGSAIAGHLANVGIPSFLLDIVPQELTEEERKKGLTLESPEVRNRFSTMGKKKIQEISPSPLYLKEDVELITCGNFEDHLTWISEADWVIEAVVENLAIKKELLKKIQPFLKENAVISSNTSGISIRKMCEGLSEDFKERFLGTHFFNPPRYMKLLEIIPSPFTSKDIIRQMADFSERVLGKGVVYAKDTPNFIANRIGAYSIGITIRTMIENGYKIEEVDYITGEAMGRPRLATFRLIDLIGIDVIIHGSKNLYENLPEAGERECFLFPSFIQKMFERQWLGQKSKQGFYKRIKEGEREETFVLDYEKLDYRPPIKVNFPSVEMGKSIDDIRERIKILVTSSDRGSEFAWKILKKTILYAAEKIPEISDDILNIDRAMRWGYNWELGPFEIWDAIGLKYSIKRMEKEGEKIPHLVEQLLKKGYSSFYEKHDGQMLYFDIYSKDYQKVEDKPEIIILQSLKDQKKTVISSPEASLIDIGDGVVCLEFHSKMNTIGPDTIRMIRNSLKELKEKFDGMVIGNQGQNFSVGANLSLLLFELQNENWDEIDASIKAFQDILMEVKYFEKPIVAAPFGMTIGGGCEICLASHRIRACAETYMGLVELGVGLIPAGGGVKEMIIRSIESIPEELEVDYFPFIRRAFETVAEAKVSSSAKEAKKLGYMRSSDLITMNRDHLIYDAKRTVLDMIKENYRPPLPKRIKVVGEKGYSLFQIGLFYRKEGGYISEYDEYVAKKLAYVFSGGNLPDNTEVTEQYILDLEREAFLSLCREERTQKRIEHMLKTGRPLRN
jgi:3-hydroxyacyl-CoA dehydrogenase